MKARGAGGELRRLLLLLSSSSFETRASSSSSSSSSITLMRGLSVSSSLWISLSLSLSLSLRFYRVSIVRVRERYFDQIFRVSPLLRKTANANNFFKTGRDCEHLLHFYQVKIVNIDTRRIHAPNTSPDRHTRVLGKIVVEQAYFRLQKKVDFTISSHFSCKIGLFCWNLAENSCKISVFWFSILQLFSKIVVFSNCEKRPILQLFSENSCKIRDFFFAKAPY